MSTVSTRNYASAIVTPDGEVAMFGFYKIPSWDMVTEPTIIPGLNSITRVSVGLNHILFLDDEGEVWVYGSGGSGQLGLSTLSPNSPNTASGARGGLGRRPLNHPENLKDQRTPVKIPNLPVITAIAAGREFSLLLTEAGQVLSFGFNGNGRLGYPSTREMVISRDINPIPTVIPNLPPIKAIAAGELHSLLLDHEGRVYSFGGNLNEQLGLGDINQRDTPTPIPDLPPIKYISAGDTHSLVVDNQGQVWGFGSNRGFQLGLQNYVTYRPTIIPGLSAIVKVSTGRASTLALDDQGQVFSFGSDNLEGILGLSSPTIYVRIPTLIPNLPPIAEVAAGDKYSLIIDQEGQVYAFGNVGLSQINITHAPTAIEGLFALLPSGENTPYYLVEYEVIESLLKNGIIGDDFSIRQYSGEDTLLEFRDSNDNIYLSWTKYNSSTDKVDPPSEPRSYFDILSRAINSKKLDYFDFHEDIPLENNLTLEFTTRGQRYLIAVQYKNGQVYPPI